MAQRGTLINQLYTLKCIRDGTQEVRQYWYYTLFKKTCNIFEDAFLLGKSVYQ